nr:hypothetical protein [Tanacetum cinerariifolium]
LDYYCCQEGYDVTRLQALVDKKKVVVTKASIRDALRLDDVEGVECLPNEEIFTELARMGYEKHSTKLNFYKFLHGICCHMPVFRKQVGDLSTHSTKYTSSALTHKVFANMRRVGKVFSRVETPLFEGMLVRQEIDEGADEVPIGDVNTVEVTAKVNVSVANDEVPTTIKEPSILSQDIPLTSQALEITKLKQRVKKLERRNKGRMITNMDVDVNVVLEEAKDVVADVVKDVQDADVKDYAHDQEGKQNPRQKSTRLTWNMLISITIIATDAQVPAAITTAALGVTGAPRRRKGVVIRDLEESTTSIIIPAETKSKDKGKGILGVRGKTKKNIDWDEVIDHVHKKAKEDPAVKRYQALKRKPQTDAQARNNMMIYLKNVIDKEESRALKRLNETQAEKATKRQKLDEEVEDLKRHLQIVPNKEDDVYTEATTLALKFPVVDYDIYKEHNKPYYKIKRANSSHQLYLSFLKWKYPLIKFTLNQMLNNVRLEVEEECEVSLELLSFGVDAAEDLKGKRAKCLMLPSQVNVVD